jgi:hypothetical protein
MDERNPRSHSEDIDRPSEEDLIGSSQDDDFEDVDEMDEDEDEDAEGIEE